jgi:hypothetical protein
MYFYIELQKLDKFIKFVIYEKEIELQYNFAYIKMEKVLNKDGLSNYLIKLWKVLV